jgi:hypothetical protein
LHAGVGGKMHAMAGHGRTTLAHTLEKSAWFAAQVDFDIGVAAQPAQ